MNKPVFHEPQEQPSTRWVTYRRYRELLDSFYNSESESKEYQINFADLIIEFVALKKKLVITEKELDLYALSAEDFDKKYIAIDNELSPKP